MITYRQAVAQDITALISLLEEIMEHHGVSAPGSDRLAAIVTDILSSKNHTLIVAETPHGLVGMCALIFSYSTWTGALACELQDVVVTRGHRRNRIGRGLVEAAEKVARERGCGRLSLLAEAWNLDAHAFYRSLGLMEKTCLYFERDLSD